ncbi:hypothetical protein BDA99DRAFT_533892 [Phascolomyces articulosus]|uniref:Uncharacterized protein n=1 Tax=Phascolomyces articulosus TaxID=60185 RepID=A0AAD5KK38_9FUNG|nr:hypothetical protein BDA99DRAFT_533892 [Phascolomyces articulosus]
MEAHVIKNCTGCAGCTGSFPWWQIPWFVNVRRALLLGFLQDPAANIQNPEFTINTSHLREQVFWGVHQDYISQMMRDDPLDQLNVYFSRWVAQLSPVHRRRQLVDNIIANHAQAIARTIGVHSNYVVHEIRIRARRLFGHHRHHQYSLPLRFITYY